MASSACYGYIHNIGELQAYSTTIRSHLQNDSDIQTNLMKNRKEAPLLFIENNGQVIDDAGNKHPEILFTTQSGGAKVYVTANAIHYVFTSVVYENDNIKKAASLRERENRAVKANVTERVTVSLKGGNLNAEVVPEVASPYYENFYLSHCPNGVTAHSFEKIRVKNVYPGIDWVIYSQGQGLKYDFVASRPILANQIRLQVTGAKAGITQSGELKMNSNLGQLLEEKPVSFQGKRVVETHFQSFGNNTFGFNLRNFKANEPVVIDPTVVWSTYYGGNGIDEAWACATDRAGNAYVTGLTYSSNFPVESALQTTLSGGADAFVVKIDRAGVHSWATYYGGARDDEARACMVDNNGNVYLTGGTTSANFPIASAFQPIFAGGVYRDAFLVKLDNAGSRLWATYYGGSDWDEAWGCAVTPLGEIYITGRTCIDDFPVASASQPTYGGGYWDAFLVKFSATGSRLWATYFGGSADEYGKACAADSLGNVYITGRTVSGNLPVTSAFQTSNAGQFDAFLAKFSSSGTRLWATYYGGTENDYGNDCVVDYAGNVYMTGETQSANFPIASAFQSTYRPGGIYEGDAFLVKFSPAGARLWATYYGGNDEDQGEGCAVDGAGNVYIAGRTASSNFPVASPFQLTRNIGYDAFLVKFSGNGSRLWATFCGANKDDFGRDCAVDPSGAIYITGWTLSTNFLTYSAPLSAFGGGTKDGFLVKICEPPLTPIISANKPTTLCAGESVRLTAPAGFTYLWSNGATTRSIDVSAAGTHMVRTISAICTSQTSAPTDVKVNGVSHTSIVKNICQGSSFTFAGTLQMIAGTYLDTLINVSGCDSVVALKLIVDSLPETPSISLMAGDSLQATPVANKYIWYCDNLPLANLITPKISVKGRKGSYTVRMVAHGCTSLVSNSMTVGQANTPPPSPIISIWPNPVSEKLAVSCTNCDLLNLQLYDIIGRTAWSTKASGNTIFFDCQDLPRGTYLIQIETTVGTLTRKLVLE